MSRRSKWEYLKALYGRYRKADRAAKRTILDEFCATCGYHRKAALRLLNGPAPGLRPLGRRPRAATYGPGVVGLLATETGQLQATMWWATIQLIYPPLWRGSSAMCVGEGRCS